MGQTMGEGYNFAKFSAAILAHSVSTEWDEAKTEWELYLVYEDGSERVCECGHQPIHQICVIENRENREKLEVGNVCVHNFLKLLSKRIFSVIRRVRLNQTKSLNPAALDLFRRRGIISQSEYDDYEGYWRKRTTPTDDEKIQKADINSRVIDYVDSETARMIQNFIHKGIKPRI